MYFTFCLQNDNILLIGGEAVVIMIVFPQFLNSWFYQVLYLYHSFVFCAWMAGGGGRGVIAFIV